jgi:DnaJ like chaperone protein
MMWHGKLIGALLGLLFSKGNSWGIVVGVIIGHYFDTMAMRGREGSASNPRVIQDAFFRATFQVMGHVAKADGRVSEEEIRAARAVMNQFRLGEPEVRLAIDLFTQGKSGDFPLVDTVSRLAQQLNKRPDLRRMFVQIQLQAALWGGSMHAQVRLMLVRVCQGLGVSEFELAQMEAILRMQRSSSSSSSSSGARAQRSTDSLDDAYGVLGVTPAASDAEVTKAYRRQMSQNHPDKLAAKGLPESMKSVAEEKTKQIRAAFEAICEVRGMK